MEVFTEVLEPLVKVTTPNLDIEHVHNFDIILLLGNTQGGCLTMSKFTICTNIMHSFDFVYYTYHIVLFLDSHSDVSTEEPPFIQGG